MPGKGFTESILARGFAGKDELMAVFTDSSSNLFAATYDGLAWTITHGGAPLETSIASLETVPFSLDLVGDP